MTGGCGQKDRCRGARFQRLNAGPAATLGTGANGLADRDGDKSCGKRRRGRQNSTTARYRCQVACPRTGNTTARPTKNGNEPINRA